jgi:hypothetical protein
MLDKALGHGLYPPHNVLLISLLSKGRKKEIILLSKGLLNPFSRTHLQRFSCST